MTSSSKPLPPFPSREQILAYIREHPGKVTRRELVRAFGLNSSQRPQLRAILKELETGGDIARDHGRAVRTHDKLPAVTVVEIVGIDDDGDLLARPLTEADNPAAPVIYMAPERRGQAALGPGDRVLAKLTKRAGNIYEGRTIRRIAAQPEAVLGIFERVGGEARIRPVDKGNRHDLVVAPGETMDAKPGDLVRAEMLPGRRLGLGRTRVVERLSKGSPPLGLIALYDHEIPIDFSADALAQAADAAAAPLGERADLRDIPLVTIDGADARDFDDAVWAEPDPDTRNPGGWHLLVAIADVAWYVRPDDALDRCARQRGNSVYLPDRVVPMLPEALSNGWCSLTPGEDRPCLAAHLWIDAQGQPLRHRFVRGLMRSTARLTYEQIQAARDGAPDAVAVPLLESVVGPLYGAYRALSLAREKRGVLELDLPERRVVLDGAGIVTAVETRARYDSHKLIEEFMIAANVAAAESLSRSKIPCMYRIHDVPGEERLEALREVLEGMGLKLPRGQTVKPAQFNRILARVAGTNEGPLVNDMILRTQAQAEYSPDNIGHFGLALSKYCHFTSPIRRYSDLLVHRALIRRFSLGEGALEETPPDFVEVGQHISGTERRAAAAERDAVDRFVAQFLAGRVGAIFTGRISGVSRFGLFVKLSETGADGLIPRRNLPRDTYIHDERRQALRGRRSGVEYRLGDAVEVMLAEATPITGGLLLHLMESGSAKPSGRHPRKRA